MSLTHLDSGGWAVADLHRLSVYELDEDTGALIEQVLGDDTALVDPPVLREAVASGVLIDAGGNGALDTNTAESEQ